MAMWAIIVTLKIGANDFDKRLVINESLYIAKTIFYFILKYSSVSKVAKGASAKHNTMSCSTKWTCHHTFCSDSIKKTNDKRLETWVVVSHDFFFFSQYLYSDNKRFKPYKNLQKL